MSLATNIWFSVAGNSPISWITWKDIIAAEWKQVPTDKISILDPLEAKMIGKISQIHSGKLT